MAVKDLLAIRERELTSLKNRLAQVLEADQRVRAAWLSGSFSRGDHDALSDLDLSVVVSSQPMAEIVANRHEYVADASDPVLLLDVPQNAPPDGAYLLVFYAGEVGPLHVDWFWEPDFKARKPDDALVLFDRTELPVMPGAEWRRDAHRPTGSSSGVAIEPIEPVTWKITYFWAMSLIVAKYIARRRGETVARMTGVIDRTLAELAGILEGCRAHKRSGSLMPPDLAAETPSVQLV
ncbi:MAG: nucleotidyltransferase domain-containing protein [Dehalococcoidia bacterium]